MLPTPAPPQLYSEIAALYNASGHDVELRELHNDGAALVVRTLLRHTSRTSNNAGTIFGGSLFALADITASIATLASVFDLIGLEQPPIACVTHGGTIAYLRCTTGDVACTLTLPAALVAGICNDVMHRRKALRTLALDLHDPAGLLVAQANLTVSARRLRERTVRRYPALRSATTRLSALLTSAQAYAVGG